MWLLPFCICNNVHFKLELYTLFYTRLFGLFFQVVKPASSI